MKLARYLLLLLISISLVRSAEEASDVITLTSDNFDDEIAKNPIILVEFFAPWCGHCKNLAPHYEKAATELKKDNIPIAAVDANAENNRPLATRFGIRGFPTIKLFRNGEPTDYEGPRTAEGLISFMKKQTQPSVTELKTVDDATAFSTSERVVVLGFFDNKESEDYAQFVQTAEALRNSHTFGAIVGQSDVNKQFDVTGPSSVVLFKKFDEGKSVFGGDHADLKTWITSESLPLIDEIGGHNYKNYIDSGKPLGYLFVDLNVEGQKDQYVEVLRPLAQKSKGKINWVYIDWSKFAKHAERLGLSGTKVPALAIENPTNGQHFAFDESSDLSGDGLTPWLDQFLAGTLAPTIKSEAIPTDNSGPVRVVVAKNFDEVVLDDSKDVLVKFYAPWCGHCKSMAPTYEDLGRAFESNENVVIAKIDATANDVSPSYGIRGFPTLLLFPRGAKAQPIPYEGDRTLEDMQKFVESRAGPTETTGTEKDEL